MAQKMVKAPLEGAVECEVVVQKWEESELGWGIRPDGFTMHLSEEHRKAFIKDYWDRMPDEVPDEYSRPSGKPYKAYVDSETFKRVKASKNGIWGDGNNYPGSGGNDGWFKII